MRFNRSRLARDIRISTDPCKSAIQWVFTLASVAISSQDSISPPVSLAGIPSANDGSGSAPRVAVKEIGDIQINVNGRGGVRIST